ncbi:unnamed protein product [Paramecium sonneborni]|uniref:Tetratricopeptide repeat protein n=1 Tax=Paramecium sonneborni TaxID=65129 RepID=A0A8S1NLW9_9CILI|nr:unnamed protein product [Paramecium sonneborni]
MGCGSAKPLDVQDTQQIKTTSNHSKSSSSSSITQTETTKLYRRANHLIKNQKYDQATQLLERILEIDPEYIDAYYSKGIIQLDSNNLESAQKYFQITLEKQPNHALALNELASIMIQNKSYQQALGFLEKGFQSNPGIPDINYGLGYVLSRLKRKNEAIHYFDLAIKQEPTNKHYYVSKATTLSDLQQYDNALQTIQNALNIDSEYIDGVQALAYIYRQSKQYDKLEEVCNQILKLDNQNYFALNCKQEIQKKSGKQPQIPLKQITVEDQLKEAFQLQQDQKLTQALDLLNSILDKNASLLQALRLKAQIQIQFKLQAGSLITLNQILTIQPNDIDALKEKVKILEYLNKNEELLKCYDSILAQQSNFEIMEKKASILIKLDKIQEASQIYEYLYSQSNQDDPNIFIIRGKLLQTQKKFDDAIICLNDGHSKFPLNIEILNLLALIYKITMKEQLALEVYQKILNIVPSNQQYLYEKGLILFRLNNFSESFEIFSQLEKSQYTQKLDYYIGICHNEKKEYSDALKYLNLYIKNGKEDLEKVYFIMGQAYLYLLNFDEAIESYLRCIQLNPNNAEAYFQLGNVYKQDKLLEEAKKAYEQALKIDNQNNLYKQTLENLINEKSYLQDYRNSLLFTLITFIGCCQLDPKANDYEKKQNEKYLTLLTLLETHLKKRFKKIDKHFEQLKELIGQSYDMKLTLIDVSLFPIMQFWHNQKICKKKKDNNDLVVSMINAINTLINSNSEKILNFIQNGESLNNRFCVDYLSKCQHESYQKRSGNIGLFDGIKILGFLIKYHKEFNQETQSFSEFIADKYFVDEIQIFHDSYYHQNG